MESHQLNLLSRVRVSAGQVIESRLHLLFTPPLLGTWQGGGLWGGANLI